jgi:hypothetical protein
VTEATDHGPDRDVRPAGDIVQRNVRAGPLSEELDRRRVDALPAVASGAVPSFTSAQ